jgi:hypothetical protein
MFPFAASLAALAGWLRMGDILVEAVGGVNENSGSRKGATAQRNASGFLLSLRLCALT